MALLDPRRPETGASSPHHGDLPRPVNWPLNNGFWLFVPPLALNLALADALPAIHQPAIFWRDIPTVMGLVENTSRVLLMVLAALLPLGLRSSRQRLGLVVYGLGMALYGAAWIALIAAPGSGWSTSAAGLAAPAYLPALWLTGIWLLSARNPVRFLDWASPAFIAGVAVFLLAHLGHVAVVLAR